MDITAIAVAKGQATAEAQKQAQVAKTTPMPPARRQRNPTQRKSALRFSLKPPPKLRNRQPDMPGPQPMPLARMKTGCFLSL